MPQIYTDKKKWKIQRPDGEIVEFWGPRNFDQDPENMMKAAGYQAELNQQKKSQKMMDYVQKVLPQTNSTLGNLAGKFAESMHQKILPIPTGEEYFDRISEGTGREQPAQGMVDRAGQAITGGMLDLAGMVNNPVGLLSALIPGAGILKAARPAAQVATRALPKILGTTMAPGAAMDINQAYQDPTTENVTTAMGSTGGAALGLLTGQLPKISRPSGAGIGTSSPTPPPGMGVPYQISAGPQTSSLPPKPPLPNNRLLTSGEPFQQPPQRPFNPPPSPASAMETEVIRPGPLPPGMGTPEITGMGVQGEVPPTHPLAIHPRTAGILERAAAEPTNLALPEMGPAPEITFPRSNVQPPAPIPFPQRLMEPLPPMPEPGGRTVTRPNEIIPPPVEKTPAPSIVEPKISEPVMGEEFAKERSSRGERLAPEVLEQARAQAAEERATQVVEKAKPPSPIEPPPAPEVVPQSVPVPKIEPEPAPIRQAEPTPAPVQETKSPTIKTIPGPAAMQQALDKFTEGQKTTRKVERGKPTPVVERPSGEVSTAAAIEPRTIGNFTIEASGDPKLPYQLREGDTVMSKGLKPDSFDAYIKRREREAAESKAIEDKYRDVDEEPATDIPEGFQEEVIPPPTPEELEAMGMKPKRVVERPSKKKIAKTLAERRPGERGSISTKPTEGPSEMQKVREDWTRAIEDSVSKLGPAGKEIARLMSRARLVGEHYSGQWESRAKDALANITDEEFGAVTKDNKVLRGNLIDVLEGNTKPKNSKIAEAANRIRDLLDETGTKAEGSGASMRAGDKNVPFEKRDNYFPHLYTEGFWARIKNDANFKDKVLQRIVNQNEGMTMDQAQKLLQRSRQFGERLISPQHERVFNLPGWERSKGALMKHLHDMGRMIGNAEEVGPKDIAGSKLNDLIKKTTDPEYAYELLKRAMKRDEPPTIRDTKVANAITTAVAWGYLSRAAIGNLGQITRIPLHTSFRSTAKAFGKYITDRSGLYNEALRSGATVEIGAKGLMEEFGSKSRAYKVYGIEQSEKFLRSVASAAGRSEAEANFRLLKSDPTSKQARIKLEDLLQENVDDVLKQGSLTEKQSSVAGGRAAELTQGRAEAMDLPKKWTGSPYMNLFFLYKKYAFQEQRNMAKAIKKAPIKSIATIAALDLAAGEAIGDIKEILKGIGVGLVKGDTAATIEKKIRERGVKISDNHPILGRVLDNYLQRYTFGIWADTFQNLKRGELSGTVGSMAGDITEAGIRSVTKPETATKSLGKVVTSKIPVLGPGISEGLFPKEEPKRKGPPRRVLRPPRRPQPSP